MKNMKLIRTILMVFVLSKAGYAFATAQAPDFLIIGKDTFSLCNNPLEAYLEQKGSQTIGKYELKWTNTALWRGYVATWELKSDSLFLVYLQDDYGRDANIINLSDEFGTDRVFDHWVTDTLLPPRRNISFAQNLF